MNIVLTFYLSTSFLVYKKFSSYFIHILDKFKSMYYTKVKIE